ncbi:MAG: agmatinase [Candidatus Hydrogenedentota bacterium]|nr:MAG: agmatinase [Candidatus Hydrogenedentota bacterium]
MAGTKKRAREDWFYHSHNFGALPSELCSAGTSKIVLLPVPYEATTTYRPGCAGGPRAVIEASANMELYDEELLKETCEVGIHTSMPLDVVDDAEEMIERVEAVTTAYLRQGKFITLLGGEHTVSLGAVRALSRVHTELSVLFLDAHADFRKSYRGNKYNHACVGRRIAEVCSVIQAGVRSLSAEEAVSLRKSKAVTFWAYEFLKSRGTEEQDALIERVVDRLAPDVYVSIDADVFDPSIMPAVGTPEPGGLVWHEVLGLLRAVAVARKVVGLDLVELAPVPGLVHPEFMAARLLYKAWGYALKVQ